MCFVSYALSHNRKGLKLFSFVFHSGAGEGAGEFWVVKCETHRGSEALLPAGLPGAPTDGIRPQKSLIGLSQAMHV